MGQTLDDVPIPVDVISAPTNDDVALNPSSSDASSFRPVLTYSLCIEAGNCC